MPNLGLPELVLLAVVLLPFAGAIYLLWRFVRALERRKGGTVQVQSLTDEVRALRTQVALLSSELTGLDKASPREPDRTVPPGGEGAP